VDPGFAFGSLIEQPKEVTTMENEHTNLHKLERKESRKEQKYKTFINRIAERASLEKGVADEVTRYFLGQIVQRITYTEANDFICQLPEWVQEELEDLPAGPNETISLSSIVHGLIDGFSLTEAQAKEVMLVVWDELKNKVSMGEMEDVLFQLPKSLRHFLEPLQ
jgi:uncharacterized protein (DUF2267 family)